MKLKLVKDMMEGLPTSCYHSDNLHSYSAFIFTSVSFVLWCQLFMAFLVMVLTVYNRNKLINIIIDSSEKIVNVDSEEVENETTRNEIFPPLSEINVESEKVDVTEEKTEAIPRDIFDLRGVDEEENEIDVDLKLPTISVSGIDGGLFQ